MQTKVERVLDVLIYQNVIPKDIEFDITEFQLSEYIKMYAEIHGKGNSKYDRKFARKLAGVNLLKYKLKRGATYKSCKEGLLYFIENPAFPEYFKVGMTIDLDKRLNSYQTYDPHRKYKVNSYEFVLNRSIAEKQILQSMEVDLHQGEWIKKTDVGTLLKQMG